MLRFSYRMSFMCFQMFQPWLESDKMPQVLCAVGKSSENESSELNTKIQI